MTPDDLKQHIVKLNGGSGCIVQPLNDPAYTYLLTAKHVIEKEDDPTVISISRLVKIDKRDWEDVEVYKGKLSEGKNYFPHTDLDAAIIRVSRINEMDKMIATYDFDFDGSYRLGGFPEGRRGSDGINQGYRSNAETKINETGKNGFVVANLDRNPTLKEVRGQSGGGVAKLEKDRLLLAGVQVRMSPGKEQLGNVEIASMLVYDDIIDQYKDRLSPIISDRNQPAKRLVRELVNIKLGSLQIDDKLNTKLVKLIEQNSERIIFQPKNPRFTINECTDELFRNWDIVKLEPKERTQFREKLGAELFEILWNTRQDKIKNVLDKQDTLLMLTFNKTDWDEEDEFNYSNIPWEFLYYPGNKKIKDTFDFVRKFPIIRNIKGDTFRDGSSLEVSDKRLKELKVLYVVNKSFSLRHKNKAIPIRTAIEKLKEDLVKTSAKSPRNAVKIDFEFYDFEENGINSINDEKFRSDISSKKPNVLHIVADVEEPKSLIYAIEKLGEGLENQRPYLLIQQSTSVHSKGQYINYDDAANSYLRGTNLAAVMNIPCGLGPEYDFFTISSFYKDLVKGRKLSESFFILTGKILNKDGFSLPALYLNNLDIVFSKPRADSGKSGANPESGNKRLNEKSAPQLAKSKESSDDPKQSDFEILMDQLIRGENVSNTEHNDILVAYKKLISLHPNDVEKVRNIREKYLDKLKFNLALANVNKMNNENDISAETRYNQIVIILKKIYEYGDEDLDKLINEYLSITDNFLIGNLFKPNS